MIEHQFDDIWAKFNDDNPLPIPPSEHGSGDFGAWILDPQGRPAYRYLMDERSDPRAAYRTSRGESRDHWHLVGNERLSATAHNGGFVQVYDWSRGGKCLNRWHPESGHYSGGFKYLSVDGDSIWTRTDCARDDLEMERIFGEGYFRKATRWRGLALNECISAPMDDTPLLVSESQIENLTDAPVEVALTEYWDVNLHQLTPVPLMTHGLADWFEKRRARINNQFDTARTWDDGTRCARVEFSCRDTVKKDIRARSMVDHFPKCVFLAAVDGEHSAACELEADAPAGTLRIRRVFTLGPGERRCFRYVFGTAEPEKIPLLLEGHRNEIPFPPTPAVELHVPGVPWLTREMHWHSYYLQAGTYYHDYYESHFVDQGSAYSYMQGLSGAPRDYALYTVPMVYLRPELAKDMLRFALRAQCGKSGKFFYGHVGFGLQRGYVLHSYSSDLDLFTLWALAEYIGAAQDHAFWQETLSYYPKENGKSGTVLDHARASFAHLRDVVGLGKHGLIRSRSGDWNDVLMAYSGLPIMTFLRGESSLNAGLATVALPMLADAVEAHDAGFAAELRAFAEGQKNALRQMMGKEYVARGYLGYLGKKLGEDRLFLDAQGFGVIGGVWSEEETRRLFTAIDRDCTAPQKVGALALWPPMKGLLLDPGSDTNGGTWAAIDGWTAWAWSLCEPARAWDFFLSSTLAARAEAYPDTWYGVWSGPDSYNAHYHPRASETFLLNFTPMTDYPVMNMNRHACPLLAAIKMAGVRVEKNVIVIEPRIPHASFSLRTPLLGFACHKGMVRGYYAPVCGGTFRFRVRAPGGRLLINGKDTATGSDGWVYFEAEGRSGERICWESIQ